VAAVDLIQVQDHLREQADLEALWQQKVEVVKQVEQETHLLLVLLKVIMVEMVVTMEIQVFKIMVVVEVVLLQLV
jgi:hypothetical protein